MKNNKENSIPVVSFAIEGYVAAETRHWKSNELVQREENHNIVVNLGLNNLAKLLGNITTTTITGWPITYGVIGTGGASAPAAGNTSITNQTGSYEALTIAYSDVATTGSNYSQLRCTFSYATGDANNQTYNEVGLARNASTVWSNDGEPSTNTDNVLFSRATHGDIQKTSDVTLSYTYDVRFKTAS